MIKSKTLNINRKNEIVYLTFPKFDECGVRHAFTTRIGGVSKGEFSTFNTGFDRGDCRDDVYENYRRICGALEIDEKRLILSRQTHTRNVRTVSAEDIGNGITKPQSFSDVDGLISNLPQVGLVTQYADCVPLAFYDKKKHVIATSHSGWRGTAAEIGKATVERMKRDFFSNPEDIIAGIGPCIGACCYEVDDPVYSAFAAIPYMPLDKVFSPRPNGKYMLDLKTANKYILLSAGISEDNMDVADICTCCEHEWLHSHRHTGGKRGNLGLIISL